MITVIIRHEPSGATEEVLLSDVPRVGDDIRLANGDKPTLVVEQVLWQAARNGQEPQVFIGVRQRPR